MSLQIKTVKHQIAATKRLIASGCKQFIVQLLDLEAKLEKLHMAAQRKFIEAITNRNKVAYITNNNGIHVGAYPIESQQRKYNDGLNAMGTIETTGLNGVFDLQSVVMNHYQITFLVIENGDVVLHTAHRAEVKAFQAGIKLPALQGSPKQIKWAEDLRRKYILVAEPSELSAIANETRSTFFINWQTNRFSSPAKKSTFTKPVLARR